MIPKPSEGDVFSCRSNAGKKVDQLQNDVFLSLYAQNKQANKQKTSLIITLTLKMKCL